MDKKTVLLAIILLITSVAFTLAAEAEEVTTFAERPPAGLMVLDLLVVRPLSASVAAASTGFCVGTMPLAYTIGVGEQSARILVEAPWRFTAMRRLGDFIHYKDGKSITVIERP